MKTETINERIDRIDGIASAQDRLLYILALMVLDNDAVSGEHKEGFRSALIDWVYAKCGSSHAGQAMLIDLGLRESYPTLSEGADAIVANALASSEFEEMTKIIDQLQEEDHDGSED